MIQKLSRLIFFIIMVYFVFLAAASIINFREKMAKIEAKQAEVDELTKENLMLKTKLYQVQRPRFIEEEARNKLNMCLPGEKVIIGQ